MKKTYKVKITNIEKVRHQATGEDFLDVSFDILEGEGENAQVVASRKQAFDPRIKKELLAEKLQMVVDTFAGEQAQAAHQAEQDAIDENVGQLAEGLTGEEFQTEVEVKEPKAEDDEENSEDPQNE